MRCTHYQPSGDIWDTAGANCSLNVFVFSLSDLSLNRQTAGSVAPWGWTWGWRASMTIIDADLLATGREIFSGCLAPNFHFSSAFLIELPVSLSCLWKERTDQSFIPEVMQPLINSHKADINVDSIWSDLPQFTVDLMCCQCVCVCVCLSGVYSCLLPMTAETGATPMTQTANMLFFWCCSLAIWNCNKTALLM